MELVYAFNISLSGVFVFCFFGATAENLGTVRAKLQTWAGCLKIVCGCDNSAEFSKFEEPDYMNERL